MRRAMWILPVFALFAALSPAEARTPQVFNCRADVTIEFTPNLIDTAWDWGITTGSGVCRTIPASQKYDVTLTGESSSPINPIVWAGDFSFDVNLHLRGSLTGEERAYSQNWQGVRVTCKIEPFETLSSRPVSVGEGHMQYCGPIPDPFGPDAPGPQPASVNWNFVGA